MGAGALLWALWLWHGTLAAPMPMPPVHQGLDRYPHIMHLKEESPLFCSRPVSRWVRTAWRAALAPLEISLTKSAGVRVEVRNEDLPPSCPFHELNDMYYLQEQSKVKSAVNTDHDKCGLCKKKFRSEYFLDRHLDRLHTLESPYVLLPSYAGGPVDAVADLKTGSLFNSVSVIQKALQPRGTCLESFCAIFDVCDRSHNAHQPVIYNDLSITYKAPPRSATSRGDRSNKWMPTRPVPNENGQYPLFNETSAAPLDPFAKISGNDAVPTPSGKVSLSDLDGSFSPKIPGAIGADGRPVPGVIGARDLHFRTVDEGPCSAKKLKLAHIQCIHLINNCFPMAPADEDGGSRSMPRSTVAPVANIFLRNSLCAPLASCAAYLARRRFSGSSRKFSEAVTNGYILRPPSAWTAGELSLALIGSVVGVAGCFLACCCYRTRVEDDAQERRSQMAAMSQRERPSGRALESVLAGPGTGGIRQRPAGITRAGYVSPPTMSPPSSPYSRYA